MSTFYLSVPLECEKEHLLSWTSAEEESTSDMGSEDLLRQRTNRWGEVPVWQSVLESRPLTMKRENLRHRIRRTMVGIAPHLLELDESDPTFFRVQQFFAYYDLFCANFWIVLQIFGMIALLFINDMTYTTAIEWIFAGTMLIYCIVATGWVETTWDVLIAMYLFTFRNFAWATPGTVSTHLQALASVSYIVGDIAFVLGAIVVIFAYCDDSESIRDLFFGSVAFGAGSFCFLLSNVFATNGADDQDIDYTLWFAVLANSCLLVGRICFARSSWMAHTMAAPANSNKKRSTIFEMAKNSLQHIYAVQEMWKSGSLTDLAKEIPSDITSIEFEEYQPEFSLTGSDIVPRDHARRSVSVKVNVRKANKDGCFVHDEEV